MSLRRPVAGGESCRAGFYFTRQQAHCGNITFLSSEPVLYAQNRGKIRLLSGMRHARADRGDNSPLSDQKAVHFPPDKRFADVSGVVFRCLFYGRVIKDLLQLVDHFFILQTEFDLDTPGGVHIDLAVIIIDRIAHGMAIGGELCLQV